MTSSNRLYQKQHKHRVSSSSCVDENKFLVGKRLPTDILSMSLKL